MMVVTATDIQNNFGKYLQAVQMGDEIIILAVANEYRRQHIAEKMISYMLTLMAPDKDIVVTTYRKGVPEGIAARAFYKRLGFQEGKLTEEFGSPVQEFVLKR